jgi:hypothetical protein
MLSRLGEVKVEIREREGMERGSEVVIMAGVVVVGVVRGGLAPVVDVGSSFAGRFRSAMAATSGPGDVGINEGEIQEYRCANRVHCQSDCGFPATLEITCPGGSRFEGKDWFVLRQERGTAWIRCKESTLICSSRID